MRVNFVLLRPSRSQAEVDDGQLLELGVRVLVGLEGLVEFLHLNVKLGRIGDDYVQLARCLELLLSLGALDWVASVVVLDLLIGFGLHSKFIKD